jgi:hypothetical protein
MVKPEAGVFHGIFGPSEVFVHGYLAADTFFSFSNILWTSYWVDLLPQVLQLLVNRFSVMLPLSDYVEHVILIGSLYPSTQDGRRGISAQLMLASPLHGAYAAVRNRMGRISCGRAAESDKERGASQWEDG